MYLAIAESKDAKREAYRRAAEEIVAYKAETGETDKNIAILLGRHETYVQKLRAWHDSGFKTDTPFVMDEVARRSVTISHIRRAARDPELAKEIGKELAEPMLQTRAAIAAGPGGIINTLAMATGDLREVIEYGLVTLELLETIQKALDEFQQELDFAKQLTGGR